MPWSKSFTVQYEKERRYEYEGYHVVTKEYEYTDTVW